LPGLEGRSALSHRPTGGGARAPQSGLVALAMPHRRSTAWACRERDLWSANLMAKASRIAPRQAEGNVRGEPVGGCRTPATKPALSTPLWCGQCSRPRAGAERPLPRESTVRLVKLAQCRDVVFWASRDQITSAYLRERRVVGCCQMFHGRIRNFPKRPSQKAFRRPRASMFHAAIQRLALSTKSP
jgi:hypothetical protein